MWNKKRVSARSVGGRVFRRVMSGAISVSAPLFRHPKILAFLCFLLVFNLSVLILVAPHTASASTTIEQEMSFEGKIVTSSGQNIPDGTYNMEFRIYTGCTNEPASNTGCTAVWTEDYLNNNTEGVNFTSGTYQVNLGSICTLAGSTCENNTNSAVNFGTYPLYLSLQIGNTSNCSTNNPGSSAFTADCGGDGTMNPYILLTSTPYSFNSNELGGLTSNQFGQITANNTWTGSNTIQDVSTTALSVENGSNYNVLGADTSDGYAILGTSSHVNGAILFNNLSGTSGDTVELESGATTATYTLALPTAGATSGQCLQTASGSTTSNTTLTFSGCGTSTPNTAISKVSEWDEHGATTLSVSPSNVGDALVFSTWASNNVTVSSVSGGGVSSWTKIGGVNGSNGDIEMWLGSVTQTGSGTISVTYSGTPGSEEVAATEFTTSGVGPGTVWADEGGNAIYDTTSTTAVSYPSLTTTAASQAYVGYSYMAHASGATGSSSGFTYITTGTGNFVVYETGTAANTAYQPVATQASAGGYSTVAALLAAFNAPTSITNATATQQANFNVQAASSGSVAGVLQANTSGTGDILDLENGSGTKVATFGSAGAALFKNATNTASAFQVQNSDGETLIQGDTTASTNYIADAEFALATASCTGTTGLTDWATDGTGSPTDLCQNTTATNSYEGQTSLELLTSASPASEGVQTTSFTSTPSYTTASNYEVSFDVMQTSGTAQTANDLTVATTVSSGTAPTCTGLSTQTLSSSGFEQVSCTLTGFTASGNITALKIEDSVAAVVTLYIDGVQLQTGTSATPFQEGNIALRGIITNPIVLRNYANSTTAFQIDNASGSNLFTADTVDSAISVNSSATSGNAMSVNANSLTSGNGLNVATTSALQTAGSLLNVSDTATLSTSAGSDAASLFNLNRSLTANVTGTTTAVPAIDMAGEGPQSFNEGVGDTSWTNTYTIGSHSNNFLLVELGYSATTCSTYRISTVTYNGTSLTLIGDTDFTTISGVSGECVSFYGLIAPSTGAPDPLVVTSTGIALYMTMNVSAWYNINQTTPYPSSGNGAYTTSSGSTSSASLSASSTSGQTIVDMLVDGGTTTTTPTTTQSGQTQLSNITDSTSNLIQMAQSYKAASSSGSTTSMGWTNLLSYSSAYAWGEASIGLNGSSSSAFESVGSPEATISNNCTLTAGTCTDATNLLLLNQQYSSATGAVVAIQNAGSGDMLDLENGSNELLDRFYSNGGLSIGLASGSSTPALLTFGFGTSSTEPTVTNGAIYYNSSMNSFRCGQNGIWASCTGDVYNHYGTSSALAYTVTSPSALGSQYSVPLNDCQAGVTYIITAAGHTSEGTSGDEAQFYLYQGGTQLAETGTMTTSATTASSWVMNAEVDCSSTTAVYTNGTVTYGTETNSSLATLATTPGTDEAVSILNNSGSLGSTGTWTNTGTPSFGIYANWVSGHAHTGDDIYLDTIVVQRIGP